MPLVVIKHLFARLGNHIGRRPSGPRALIDLGQGKSGQTAFAPLL